MLARADPRRAASSAWPGGHALQRARLREVAGLGHRGAHVHTDDRVPELTGPAGGAAVDPPSEHESPADPGADREHHEVAGDHHELLVVRLGERRHGRVVVDEHGHPEPRRRAPRAAARRRAGCSPRRRPDRFEVDDRRHPEPDAIQLLAAALRDRLHELFDDLHRRWRGRSGPSPTRPSVLPDRHAAAILVPPRSTPMTSRPPEALTRRRPGRAAATRLPDRAAP